MSEKITANTIFSQVTQVAPLKLIIMRGAEEFGTKLDHYLVKWARSAGVEVDTFILPHKCPRFSSGDGKAVLEGSVRGKDLFILVDVGNYNCTYKMFGKENMMSPDDHYQDLKRVIQAAAGKAHRINVIMPTLYGGRQHRRNYRESLDCAWMLQELQSMGVENILTFDAHDPRVMNAVPLLGLDNFMPQYQVLKALFRAIPDVRPDAEHMMIVSPDEGGMNRNVYYASVMGLDLGMFYKRRDFSRVVNGRNPIVAHEYLGRSVEGMDVFIADDIISSGESMLDIAYELKGRNAGRIFLYATYGLFTNGLAAFDEAYEKGLIGGVFCTNLTYSTPELLSRPWFHSVDMSKYASYIIATLNHDVSVSTLLDTHDKISSLLANFRAGKVE